MASIARVRRARVWQASILALGVAAASGACSSNDPGDSSASGGSRGALGGTTAHGGTGGIHAGSSNGGNAGANDGGANNAGADSAGADSAGANNAGASDGGPQGPVLLKGAPSAPATSALTQLLPTASDPADIVDQLILTKLDVWISPTATVAQVNAALTAIGGGIVAMSAGNIAVTVGFQRVKDETAIEQKRLALANAPGILFAEPALVPIEETLPPAPADSPTNLGYLFLSKFPAAWNLQALAVRNCDSHPVPVWITDFFAAAPPDNFLTEVPAMSITVSTPGSSVHGYRVAAIAAANFDANPATGADPFQHCLDLRAIRMDGFSPLEEIELISNTLGGSKQIVNGSFGHVPPHCATPGACTPTDFQDSSQYFNRWVLEAADFRAQTLHLDNDVLFVAAGGNDRDKDDGVHYPLFRSSRMVNEVTMANSALLFSSPRLSVFQDAVFFQPDAAYPTFPSLAPVPGAQQALGIAVNAMLDPSVQASQNVVIAGSINALQQVSTFSNDDPDVHTVGDAIREVDGSTGSGTSYSAPQVTGLASFLWLLSDDLRKQPTSITRRAILENVVIPPTAPSLRELDAFAAALSLDQVDVAPSAQTFPIRLALLDTNNDAKFDEDDVVALQIAVPTSATPFQTWGRGDLNGDGYVGGTRTARFDLDRVASTQYGVAQYTSVTQPYGAQTMRFDENAVTDQQVLCYYAYSSLYTGSISVRDETLATACGIMSPPDGGTPDAGSPGDAGTSPPPNCQTAGTFFCETGTCCPGLICVYIDGFDYPQCYQPAHG